MTTATLLVAAVLGAAPRGDDDMRRPNVVLILCDDLGYGDLGCYGHPVIRTPHLDGLAAGGVRFTRFYAASPVCSASRAGLLTGRTPDRAGVYDWIPEGSPVHLRASEATVPSALAAAGYDCGHFGKWHLNGVFNAPQQPQPHDHGFRRWFATQNNAAPSHRDPNNYVRDGEPVGPLTGYSCDLAVAEAERWLVERATTGDAGPFFLNLWFHEPHVPIASPPELVAAYRGRSRTELEAAYFANVANVDRAVGRLLAFLDERGLRENTLVVFTSDNGPEDRHRYPGAAGAFGSAGGLRGRKLWLYEGGIRVPGIIHWPGRIRPRVEDVPAGAVDLLPTLCALTAAAPPDRPLDGASLAPLLLRGEPVERATPLFWSYYRGLGGPVAAVREGDAVVLARRAGGGWPSGGNVDAASLRTLKATELDRFERYDTRRDPLQHRDLAASPTLDRLTRTLIDLHREARDESPTWSFPPDD